MMTRETSAIAHAEESDLGKLGKRRLQVVSALMEWGAMTANECFSRIHQRDPAALSHSITPRFAELRDRGFIAEAGERECSVTKKKAIVWKFVSKRATNLFPTRTLLPTAKGKLKLIAGLCAEIEDLLQNGVQDCSVKVVDKLSAIKSLATACILIAALSLPGCCRKCADFANPDSAIKEVQK